METIVLAVITFAAIMLVLSAAVILAGVMVELYSQFGQRELERREREIDLAQIGVATDRQQSNKET